MNDGHARCFSRVIVRAIFAWIDRSASSPQPSPPLRVEERGFAADDSQRFGRANVIPWTSVHGMAGRRCPVASRERRATTATRLQHSARGCEARATLGHGVLNS